jgi:hypothetical protein
MRDPNDEAAAFAITDEIGSRMISRPLTAMVESRGLLDLERLA